MPVIDNNEVQQVNVCNLNVAQLLEAANIKQVIYIDDRFGIDSLKQVFFGKMRSLKRQSNKKSLRKGLGFIDFNLSNAAFNSRLSAWWEKTNSEDKMQYIEKLSISKDGNSVPTSLIDKVFSSNLIKCSPEQWGDVQKNMLDNKDTSEKYICLFDLELETDNGRDGIDYALSLYNSLDDKDRVYCGIFSYTFKIEDEIDKREQIKDKLDEGYFYPISKDRLQKIEDVDLFVDGIKNLLLIKQLEKLKKESINIFNKSFSSAIERIKKITPPIFNNIILKTSEEEGLWEVKTLFRLADILIDSETKKTIKEESIRNEFNGCIDEIKKIDRLFENKYKYHNDQIKQLIKEEAFYDGELINPTYTALDNGDIFSIGDKEYILMCQPCNLALRPNGERSRQLESAFLVEIRICSDKEKCGIFKEKLKGFSDDKFAILTSYKVCNLALLDLVVYNEDGIAKINIKEKESVGVFQENWKKRYDKISKIFKNYADVLDALIVIPDGNVGKKTLEKHVFSPPCLRDLKIENKTKYEDGCFTFPIKRLGNYKAPYSSDLLYKFMIYLSRAGFDPEFKE